MIFVKYSASICRYSFGRKSVHLGLGADTYTRVRHCMHLQIMQPTNTDYVRYRDIAVLLQGLRS